MLLCFVCQFVLILLCMNEMLTNPFFPAKFKKQCSSLILMSRFICSTILHLSIVDDINAGMEMMKYSVNHHYKFVNYRIACSSGFLQVVANISIELVSIGVICAATDTISIIFNFISLAVLVEFDDFVY
jgi:hypothetical protein